MQFIEKTLTVVAAAAAPQTLGEKVVRVVSGYSLGALGIAGDTGTAMTVVTGPPGAADVQFTGTPQAPSNAITLGTAAAAGQILVLNVVVPGDMPAYL